MDTTFLNCYTPYYHSESTPDNGYTTLTVDGSVNIIGNTPITGQVTVSGPRHDLDCTVDDAYRFVCKKAKIDEIENKDIDSLKKEVAELKEQIKVLTNLVEYELHYRPDGLGAKEAKEEFVKTANKLNKPLSLDE
jgi:hypothetical protein